LTTAILRFQFPYGLVKRQSKIVLYGAGLLGRSYYAQLMLSAWADVVLWCEDENPFGLRCIQEPAQICQVAFDSVLIAYASRKLAGDAKEFLRGIGVPNEKIICEI
jgi:hypothetical protein